MERAEMGKLLCWKVLMAAINWFFVLQTITKKWLQLLALLIRCPGLHVSLFIPFRFSQFSPKSIGFCPLMPRTFPVTLELIGCSIQKLSHYTQTKKSRQIECKASQSQLTT